MTTRYVGDECSNCSGLTDEVAMLREKLATRANGQMQDPQTRVDECSARVQDMLRGNAIRFDGAGASSTQQSPRGVSQAWNIESLDANKKSSNSEALELLAAILKDYPELCCNLHGSTDANPANMPDKALASHFKLDSMERIQDELAHNRAIACKQGLEACGVLESQLVVTWKGCGQMSEVSFLPMVPTAALAKLKAQSRWAAQLAADELAALKDQVSTLKEGLAARSKGDEVDQVELTRLRSALANAQTALANGQAAMASNQDTDRNKNAAPAKPEPKPELEVELQRNKPSALCSARCNTFSNALCNSMCTTQCTM